MDMLSWILAGKSYNSRINILYYEHTSRYYGQYNVVANRIAWINSVSIFAKYRSPVWQFQDTKHISAGIKTLTNGNFWCTDTGYLDVFRWSQARFINCFYMPSMSITIM